MIVAAPLRHQYRTKVTTTTVSPITHQIAKHFGTRCSRLRKSHFRANTFNTIRGSNKYGEQVLHNTFNHNPSKTDESPPNIYKLHVHRLSATFWKRSLDGLWLNMFWVHRSTWNDLKGYKIYPGWNYTVCVHNIEPDPESRLIVLTSKRRFAPVWASLNRGFRGLHWTPRKYARDTYCVFTTPLGNRLTCWSRTGWSRRKEGTCRRDTRLPSTRK
jgi:hypothetical protein